MTCRIGIDASPLAHAKGGIGTYLFHLLRELVNQQKDHLFYLYTPFHSEDISYFEQYQNVIIRKVPLFTLWLQTVVAFFCWADDIDVFWGTVQSYPLIKKRKMRTILTLHDFTYLLFPNTVSSKRCLFLRVFSKRMFKRADYIVTVSQGTADRLMHHYGLKSHAVIHPPIKPELIFKDERRAQSTLSLHGLKYGGYVLSVGTWEPRKNYIKLIEMYLKTIRQRGLEETLPLVIIGSGGWKNKEIKKALKQAERQYPSHVKLLGYVSDQDLAAYYSGAAHFLTLSLYEGYGMPIAESRVCGTPVACPDIPEMREAAENEGIFFTEAGAEAYLEEIFLAGTLRPKPCIRASYLSNCEKAQQLSKIIQLCTP